MYKEVYVHVYTCSDSFICFATEAIEYSPYGDAMSMISDLPFYYMHIKSQASEYSGGGARTVHNMPQLAMHRIYIHS